MSAEEPGLPSPAGMDATWGLLDDIMLGGGLDQTSGLTGAPSPESTAYMLLAS